MGEIYSRSIRLRTNKIRILTKTHQNDGTFPYLVRWAVFAVERNRGMDWKKPRRI